MNHKTNWHGGNALHKVITYCYASSYVETASSPGCRMADTAVAAHEIPDMPQTALLNPVDDLLPGKKLRTPSKSHT